MNRRGMLFWIGLALVLITVAYLSTARRNETGRPLDPDSTDGLGTAALIELMERFDAEVTFGLPTDDTSTTLILTDQLIPDQRQEVEDWLRSGGTLVVVGPGSSFAADLGPIPSRGGDELTSGTCTVADLDGLTLAGGSFLLQDVSTADATCFGNAQGAYLHVSEFGQGRVISLGGGLALSNQYLDEADNAVLAVELLLPTPDGGDRSVSVLYDPVLTPGSRSLFDLVSSPARWTGAQLLVAFGVYVLWRARRFGRPVPEPQPVKLPGSLLVRATAELNRRTGGFAAADLTVRDNHERILRRRLRAAPELPLPDLVELATAAAGIDRRTVERALLPAGASNKDELVARLRAVDAVNEALAAAEDQVLLGDQT